VRRIAVLQVRSPVRVLRTRSSGFTAVVGSEGPHMFPGSGVVIPCLPSQAGRGLLIGVLGGCLDKSPAGSWRTLGFARGTAKDFGTISSVEPSRILWLLASRCQSIPIDGYIRPARSRSWSSLPIGENGLVSAIASGLGSLMTASCVD
jgi:hypothetical protein